MRSIPKISVKRIGDAEPGELIRAGVYGAPALGFLTSTKDEGNQQTLGLWLELGADRSEPELRYVQDDAPCVSYGDDWAIEPDMSSLFAYVSGAHLAMHKSSGWLLRSPTGARAQFDWYSLADGGKISSPNRDEAVFFSSFRISVAAGPYRDLEVFAYPGPGPTASA